MRKVLFSLCLVLLVVGMMAFAGCGGNKETVEQETEKVTSKPSTGTFKAELDGVDLTLTIPAEDVQATNISVFISEVENVTGEKFETSVIGSLTAVNNTKNTDVVCGDFKPILTFEDGTQIDGENAFILVGEVQETIDIQQNTDLYDRGVGLYNELIETSSMMPETTRTRYFTFEVDDLDGLKDVYISNPLGMKKVQMKE